MFAISLCKGLVQTGDKGVKEWAEPGGEGMGVFWLEGLGRVWSWACGPNPRNDRAGGGAAQAQGHCVIVTMATNTSLQGT